MAAEGETNVKDYGIFTDAVSTINNFNTNIKTEYDSIKDNINTIDDEEIFAGPAAESIVSDSEAIRKNIVSSYKNFQQMGKNFLCILHKNVFHHLLPLYFWNNYGMKNNKI